MFNLDVRQIRTQNSLNLSNYNGISYFLWMHKILFYLGCHSLISP